MKTTAGTAIHHQRHVDIKVKRSSSHQDQQQQVHATTRRGALASMVAAAAAAADLMPPLPPIAQARIATERIMQQSSAVTTGGFDPNFRRGSAPAETAGRSSSAAAASTSGGGTARSAAADALARLEAARGAAAEGRWQEARDAYAGLAAAHPDLALAIYGRIGEAITDYELGNVSSAIVLLDELEVTDRGAPEVHAALAAVLWKERPRQRLRAEQQFEIATEFDPRYSDPDFVKRQKLWPPRLVAALRQFLELS